MVRAIRVSRYKRRRTELQLTSTIQQQTRETHKDHHENCGKTRIFFEFLKIFLE